MKKMNTPKCAECRKGEIREDATVQVRGVNADGRRIPKKFLCDDHLAMEAYDGAKYQIVSPSDERKARVGGHLNEIVRKFTGWSSFAEMCLSNPTLRPGTFDGVEILRVEYKKATGREAFA